MPKIDATTARTAEGPTAGVGDLRHWVPTMSEKGVDLPDELRDATFKRPGWMGGVADPGGTFATCKDEMSAD